MLGGWAAIKSIGSVMSGIAPCFCWSGHDSSANPQRAKQRGLCGLVGRKHLATRIAPATLCSQTRAGLEYDHKGAAQNWQNSWPNILASDYRRWTHGLAVCIEVAMIEIKISKAHRNTYGDRNTNVVWQWCIDNFGLPEPNGRRWAWDTNRTYWFHNEADAVFFALKWSWNLLSFQPTSPRKQRSCSTCSTRRSKTTTTVSWTLKYDINVKWMVSHGIQYHAPGKWPNGYDHRIEKSGTNTSMVNGMWSITHSTFTKNSILFWHWNGNDQKTD